MTPRLVYLPIPSASCSEPSRAQAMAHTFSVQERSLWATAAKVSVIWWLKVSSAGTSGPRLLITRLPTPHPRAARAATGPSCAGCGIQAAMGPVTELGFRDPAFHLGDAQGVYRRLR